MSRKRIFVVEDEPDMADLVASRLTREGYLVETSGDGLDAWERILARPPDLALVDIMLPGMSGTELVTHMREDPRTASVPVVMMTAKAAEQDIVAGLCQGADDYVTKPLSLSVLAARVSAVMRRTAALRESDDGVLRVGALAIDTRRHVVTVGGEALDLTPTEYRLLVALAAARGGALTRDQLIDQSMGLRTIVTHRTIDVHLAALRRKLGDARDTLRTVRGVGYRLAADGTESDEST
jgi:two-component system phosphate regulon response regulator PhoB